MARVAGAVLVSVVIAGVSATQGVSQAPTAAQTFDLGKREYDAHCAACHGMTGQGEGSYSSYLNKTIPDLTTLSKRNGGVFPLALVYEAIDGTRDIGAHGTRDMPIWGTRYKAKVDSIYFSEQLYDPEAYVRGSILALAEYVYRLQAK